MATACGVNGSTISTDEGMTSGVNFSHHTLCARVDTFEPMQQRRCANDVADCAKLNNEDAGGKGIVV